METAIARLAVPKCLKGEQVRYPAVRIGRHLKLKLGSGGR